MDNDLQILFLKKLIIIYLQLDFLSEVFSTDFLGNLCHSYTDSVMIFCQIVRAVKTDHHIHLTWVMVTIDMVNVAPLEVCSFMDLLNKPSLFQHLCHLITSLVHIAQIKVSTNDCNPGHVNDPFKIFS